MSSASPTDPGPSPNPEDVPFAGPVKPRAVFWVGAVWTCLGTLGLSLCLWFCLSLFHPRSGPPPVSIARELLQGVAWFATVLSGMFGARYLVMGIPTMLYRARDLLFSGWAALITAGLYLSLGIFHVLAGFRLRALAGEPRPGAGWTFYQGLAIQGLIDLSIFTGLAACGFLVLRERPRYLAYRSGRKMIDNTTKAQKPPDDHRPRYVNPWSET